jgi:hypothetical protein
VNEYLQSVSNPAVSSARDAAVSGNQPLTPVAGFEGGIVAENLLHGNREKVNLGVVPTVAYTIPRRSPPWVFAESTSLPPEFASARRSVKRRAGILHGESAKRAPVSKS